MSNTSTPNPQTLDTISLFYKEGNHDKEYHLSIVGDEEKGYKVQFRYGKRGSKLTVGFKNNTPTDLSTAKSIFEEQKKAKMNKGYTPSENGTPYVGTENQGKVAGVRPMLLGEIDEAEALKLIADDNWVMQEKKNGVRCMVVKKGKSLEGVNKKGLITSLPETTANAIRNAVGHADATLDGELVGECFWLFDLLSAGVHAYTDKPYSDRLVGIQEWIEFETGMPEQDCYFKMVPTAVGKSSKKDLLAKLRAENAEGVVFKRKDAAYQAGRSDNNKKFKFYATATVRCKHLNNKNSFRMEMLSKGDWVEVGDCTFYPTVYAPKPGDFVEVRYMYAFPQGSLYGPPVIIGKREDCGEDDCVMSQLKYKQGSEVPNDDDIGEEQ